jgi:radical SAM superfamily enzyme YgiQ (UPF0313 family)
MYRGVRYSRRSLEEVYGIIRREARSAPDTSRIFLADGDVMRRSMDDLRAILVRLGDSFPSLARVNTYATGRAILSKREEELAELRSLKLQTLYMGLESGDDETLADMNKAESTDEMVEAGCRAQRAGMRMSVMILLGLAGRSGSSRHARETALALNRMQPRLLSALRVVPVPGTPLYDDVRAGRFEQLSERGVVEELLAIVDSLDLRRTVFRADHSSNVVPLEARFPREKPRLVSQLREMLDADVLDEAGPGSMPMWL